MTTPNSDQENPTHKASSDIAFRVIDFLLGHGLSTEPVHYAVAHAYVEGNNPAVTTAIDTRLAAGKSIDAFYLVELFEEHLTSEAARHFRGVGGEVGRLLDGLISDIKAADEGSSSFAASLQANIAQIGDSTDSANLQQIAQSLLQAAVSASESNAALKQNLAAADQEAKQLRDELERHRRETLTDPLTGLFNRRGMESEMARLFSDQDIDSTSMLVLDIDHFKRINDTYGHAVGDVVIRKVAETLKGLIPDRAVPVRFGGEEFAVLLAGSSPDHAQTLAEKIRATIERLKLVRRHDQLAISQFTISIGVAMRTLSDDIDALFERADKALYEAKTSGRNRVIMAA
ncbi:MAG: diguanylate cyclase [Rhodocyclaceae bacterium]|nr:diguanylate cyclase [Rhodocyclaceae bacterium]